MNKILASIGVIVIGILMGALLTLPFSVYVIMDIGRLYNVERIMVLPKESLYGLMLILSIVTHKIKHKKKNEETKDTSDNFVDLITGFIETVLVILVVWGFAYIVHAINF